MMSFVWFLVGMLVGGSTGIAFMCCFQLNNLNKLNDEIYRLKKEFAEKTEN